MNRSQKEALKEKLEKLEPEEHAQIFQVIRQYTENYTKTSSGVLVSSDSLPAECLTKIDAMVSYYMDQRNRLDLTRRK